MSMNLDFELFKSKVHVMLHEALIYRPFPHSNKQWHRAEVGVDKNTANV